MISVDEEMTMMTKKNKTVTATTTKTTIKTMEKEPQKEHIFIFSSDIAARQ